MSTTSARERLARQLTGQVYDGATADAAAEAAGFNTAVTHRPAAVVAARTAQDVAAAVAPRERARAAGHGPGHRSRRGRAVGRLRARLDQGDAARHGRPGRPSGTGRGRRPLAVGDRRRRASRARAAVRLVLGCRGGRLHPRRRDGSPRSAPRLRGRPRPLGGARHRRGRDQDRHRGVRPRAVLGGARRPEPVRDRDRARVRPDPGAPVLRRRPDLHRPGRCRRAARLVHLGADDAGGRDDLGRAAPVAAGRRRAAAAARGRQPGGAVRLRWPGRSGRGAARADAAGRHARSTTRSARCRSPRSTAFTWTRPSRCRP